MKAPFFLLSAAFLGIAPLLAQTPAPSEEPQQQEQEQEEQEAQDEQGPGRFWQARLEGGHFMVALDRIVSVSRHKYILDGAMIIDEVTIDSTGQALARFYFVSPITEATSGNPVQKMVGRGREIAEQAAGRTGVELQDMVVKKYPETSHARTIEYRILAEPQLDSLYDSVRSAWESGRGRRFSTPGAAANAR